MMLGLEPVAAARGVARRSSARLVCAWLGTRRGRTGLGVARQPQAGLGWSRLGTRQRQPAPGRFGPGAARRGMAWNAPALLPWRVGALRAIGTTL